MVRILALSTFICIFISGCQQSSLNVLKGSKSFVIDTGLGKKINYEDKSGPISTSLNLMDRTMLSSKIGFLFGPNQQPHNLQTSYNATPALTQMIRFSPEYFGGPCETYAQDGNFFSDEFVGPKSSENNLMAIQCVTPDQALASNEPRVNLSREALRIRTCDLILGSDRLEGRFHYHSQPNYQDEDINLNLDSEKSILSFVSLARGIDVHKDISKMVSKNGITKPTSEEVSSSYKLFFSGRAPASKVLSSLNNVVSTSATQTASQTMMSADEKNLDAWRFLILTLCMSPEWQVL